MEKIKGFRSLKNYVKQVNMDEAGMSKEDQNLLDNEITGAKTLTGDTPYILDEDENIILSSRRRYTNIKKETSVKSNLSMIPPELQRDRDSMKLLDTYFRDLIVSVLDME